MKFLYKVGIVAYSLFLKAAAVFNPKARQFVKGRKNWHQNLASKIETNARYLWVHCASLGEFEQGRPLIEAIKEQHPEFRIVLTFFSPSGYEIRKNYEQADVISYLPIDTKQNAKVFLNIIQPEKVFFIKYEYWYHYIEELKKRNIPLYMVSAIFREEQHFFKKTHWGKWYRQMLHKVTYFFIQDKKSASLLQSLGILKFTITGDTRFDRVATIANNAKEMPVIGKFKDDKVLVVAGSTWKPDEDLLAEYFKNSNTIKIIIAPHEVNESNLLRIETGFNNIARLSKVKEEEINKYDVLLVDSVGLLASIYNYGNIAYIGGGFGVGIHNILEAATFGLPVIFGPNYQKFKEAVDLQSMGGAFPVSNYHDLKDRLNSLIYNSSNLTAASEICEQYVAQNVGSTQKIVDKVFKLQA